MVGGVTTEIERGRERDERLEQRVRELERLASANEQRSIALERDVERLRGSAKDIYDKLGQLTWRVALLAGGLGAAGSAAGGLLGGG